MRKGKRNRLQSIPNILLNSVDHEGGAIVQFYWLVARQSKSDIRNLTFIHDPTLEHDKIKFSVQKTLKDLLPNGKHINLKLEQEAAI